MTTTTDFAGLVGSVSVSLDANGFTLWFEVEDEAGTWFPHLTAYVSDDDDPEAVFDEAVNGFVFGGGYSIYTTALVDIDNCAAEVRLHYRR